MMDIYAITRQVALVEQLFDQVTDSYDRTKAASDRSTGCSSTSTTTTTTTKPYHCHYSVEPYHILIKAYGNCNQPDRAEEFVRRRMLHPNSIVKPDIATINILINAYTESIRNNNHDNKSTRISNNNTNHNNTNNVITNTSYNNNASEAAYNIYRWLKTNPQCKKLNLRPTLVTYSTMLKVFSLDATINSKYHCNQYTSNEDSNHHHHHRHHQTLASAEKIELLFQEMENRYKVGDVNFKPDARMYNVAIKSLLAINDYDCAYNILQSMESQLYIKSHLQEKQEQQQSTSSTSNDTINTNLSDIISVRPNVRTYSEFLIYYSKMRTTDGAKLAEKLHNHMRKLSQTIDKSLTPDIFTYNMVFNAWIASGDPNTATYVWSVYEQMTQNDQIELDIYTYSNIISVLLTSTRFIDIRRTIQLLQHMHDHPQQHQQRDNGTSTSTTKEIYIGQVYIDALKGCMKRNDHINSTTVFKLLIDSYIKGHYTTNDDHKPDRAKFNWIIHSYITSNDLQSATDFLNDVVQFIQIALETTESQNTIENIAWIGPDLNTILDLRKAWTKSSFSSEKMDALSKLDNTILPTMVRLFNIEKGNIVQPHHHHHQHNN
jgi:hypothetical protein